MPPAKLKENLLTKKKEPNNKKKIYKTSQKGKNLKKIE